MVKWTNKKIRPADTGPRGTMQTVVDELQQQPGRWAEIERYSLDRKASARSRGSNATKRYKTDQGAVEYAVERDGQEFVLYMRWVNN